MLVSLIKLEQFENIGKAPTKDTFMKLGSAGKYQFIINIYNSLSSIQYSRMDKKRREIKYWIRCHSKGKFQL